MAINSVYGSIDANFSEVSIKDNISLYSVYDHVDVTVPKSIKADFRLNTSYGKMFTNLDLDVGSKDGNMKNLSNRKITGSFNGGGIDFSITATYKNIYLRKE